MKTSVTPRFRFHLRSLVVCVAIASLSILGWKCLVVPAQYAANDSLCWSNLAKISYAIQQYHSDRGTFPPAYVTGANGEPAHSWRVLILPYLDSWGIDGEEFYESYDFTEPWNGPHNGLLATPVDESRYACPCGPEVGTTLTSYVVVVGPSTIFPGAGTTSLSDLPESVDPILVLEITGSDIHWPEPRDLPFGKLQDFRLLSRHSTLRYITARGKLGELHSDMSQEEIERMFLIDASE